jgi:tetratricopeptide (TPR) repeat protein
LPRWTPRVFLIGSSLEEADASNIEHTLRRDGLELAREGRGFLERIRGVWPFTSDRDSVESAFDSSNCYIVLVSPRTVNSAAFRRSVETALARQGSAAERIVVIPALIKPCELPKALRTLQVFDMTTGGTDGARRLLAELQMLRLHPSWRPNPVEAEVPAEVPSNPVADAVRRALAAHANDEDDEAIALFTDAIKSEPRGSTYLHRGEAYWYSRRYTEALQDLSAALRMDPSLESTVRFTRGQALADAGQYSDAIQDLDWLITKEPNYRSIAYAYRGRAVARAGLGQMVDAEEDFQRSMSLAPDNAWLYYSMAKVREADLPSDWHVFNYFAQSLRRRNPKLNRLNVLDAVASIERITGKLPMSGRDIVRSLDGPDKAILQRVAKDMESGEYGLALLRAETLRALKIDESTIEQQEGAVMRCLCHRRLGNLDLANREIDMLSTLGTPPSRAFPERGYAQLRAGDIEGANRSFAMVGTTAEGLCGLALVSLRQDKLIEAEKMIQTALAFAPHNAEYLVTGARILEAAGLRANAETAYNESLQAKDPPLSIWEKNQVLEALGRLSGGTPAA